MVAKDTLAKLELFVGLPDKALLEIAALAREFSFPPHTAIFSPEQTSRQIYMLLEGSVALTVFAPPLTKPVTMAVLTTPGQAFGFSAVIGQGHHDSSAEAVTSVRGIEVDGPALLKYLEKDPEIGYMVMTRVARVISRRLGTLRRMHLETLIDYERQASATDEN